MLNGSDVIVQREPFALSRERGDREMSDQKPQVADVLAELSKRLAFFVTGHQDSLNDREKRLVLALAIAIQPDEAAHSAGGGADGIPHDLQSNLRDLVPCPCLPHVCMEGSAPKGTFCKSAKASAAPAPAATTPPKRPSETEAQPADLFPSTPPSYVGPAADWLYLTLYEHNGHDWTAPPTTERQVWLPLGVDLGGGVTAIRTKADQSPTPEQEIQNTNSNGAFGKTEDQARAFFDGMEHGYGEISYCWGAIKKQLRRYRKALISITAETTGPFGESDSGGARLPSWASNVANKALNPETPGPAQPGRDEGQPRSEIPQGENALSGTSKDGAPPPTPPDAAQGKAHVHDFERFGAFWLCDCGHRLTDSEYQAAAPPAQGPPPDRTVADAIDAHNHRTAVPESGLREWLSPDGTWLAGPTDKIVAALTRSLSSAQGVTTVGEAE